ncbi:MAG TPA: dTDP-4-dehydrorhamnose reductase, partial [Ruminococcaceae bacterium]|nr:dTDP-4-dehydrorhamnose reductase [Oscillospiraceae bacterium]
MKVLVTGAAGQLGYDVIRELDKREIEVIEADRFEFDLTDFKQVNAFVDKYKPDTVVHCAAYTAVDRAEDDAEACYRVNVIGTQNLVDACKNLDVKFVYISTDYVFDGTKETPYEVGDAIHPQSVYGATKAEGENRVRHEIAKHFILRTSWVFGKNGNNFVKTMLRLGKEKEQIKVVCDQIGSPTYTPDLARLICDMLPTDKYGTYFATNAGYCSWADFAFEIMQKSGSTTMILPIPSSEYPAKATRPLNSRLSKQALIDAGFAPLPSWQNALERFL